MDWVLTFKQDHFKELSSTAVLPFNEPVEALDYDTNKRRLVLSGHTGKIKLFNLEKNGMSNYWSRNVKPQFMTLRHTGCTVEHELEYWPRGRCHPTGCSIYS